MLVFLFSIFIMNIFVARLSYNTEESTLRQAFEAFGEVSSVKIIMDRIENRSKGFGFVEMPNDDEAQNAIDGLNESTLDGREIVVRKARPRTENQNRGGGGYRGGGGHRDRGGFRERRDFGDRDRDRGGYRERRDRWD